MLTALLAIVLAWPLVRYVAEHRRHFRCLPLARPLEWHRGPTWLGCCAGATPFVTFSGWQAAAAVACTLAAIAAAWWFGLEEGVFRGRDEGRRLERESRERRWQELTEKPWVPVRDARHRHG